MLLGPQDIARHLECRHRPGWLVWYGRHTRQYWALATWLRTPHGMFGAATPEALDAAIATFEVLHPRPRQRSHPGLHQPPVLGPNLIAKYDYESCAPSKASVSPTSRWIC